MADAAVSTTDTTDEDTQDKADTTVGVEVKTDADIEEIAAKAENPDAVRNALQRERTAAKEAREKADELAQKVREYEDRDKSEQEKLEERATTAEQRASAAETKLLRFEVATSKGLPLELADRLQGSTKKELEEDADRLLELVKRPDPATGDGDGGKGAGGTSVSLNDRIREKAGFH